MNNIDSTINEKAKKYNIPIGLVKAIIQVESSGVESATRYEPGFKRKYLQNMSISEAEKIARATSYGLMQLMGQVAIELGFKGELVLLLHPEINIEWSLKHLANFIKKYFNTYGWLGVIASYNAGSPSLLSTGKYVNQRYVDKVVAEWERYEDVSEYIK